MTMYRTIATRFSATMLATSVLAGAAAAAPKPQINLNMSVGQQAAKANIAKSIRPRIARPIVKVRVNRDRLENKAEQTDNPAPEAARAEPRKRRGQADAKLVPPTRVPQPRPEFFDKIVDLEDIIGAEDLGDIDPDAFRVGTNPHDPDGLMAGLPWTEDEDPVEQAEGPTEPAGGVPDGFGSNGTELGGSRDLGGLVGDNSHGADTPDAAPGVRVTPGSIADAKAGIAGQVIARGESEEEGQRTTWYQTEDESVSKTTDGHGNVQIVRTYNGNGRAGQTTENYMNGVIQSRETVVVTHEGDRTRTYWNYNSGMATVQRTGMEGRSWRFADPRPTRRRGPISTTWTVDPDSAPGGGYIPVNCGSWECNKARQRQANPGLQMNEWQKGKTQVYVHPDADQGAPRNSGEPIVSQTDLVAKYDPDHQDGSRTPQPLPTCFHSEC